MAYQLMIRQTHIFSHMPLNMPKECGDLSYSPAQMYALVQDIIRAWEQPLLCLNPLIQIVWQCFIKAQSTMGGNKRRNQN